jgi:hypothetical protein
MLPAKAPGLFNSWRSVRTVEVGILPSATDSGIKFESEPSSFCVQIHYLGGGEESRVVFWPKG